MTNLYAAEKLNIWDRIWNRYKKIPVRQGQETWHKNGTDWYGNSFIIPDSNYGRIFVEYHVINRLTGGYTIEKEYLN